MTNRLKTLLLLALMPLLAAANQTVQWDETLYRQVEQSIQLPQIQGKDYLITKHGAKADATAAKNQQAIQRAIDKCSRRGGGRVIIPAGQTFLTGALTMKSHVNLVVESGAVLRFVFQPELYPPVETAWEGVDCYNLSPCLYAANATDIAVTGQGTIDGGGAKDTWWPWCGAPHFGWTEGMISQNTEARPRLLQNGEDGVPMRDELGQPNKQRTFGPTDGLRPQLICFNQCERILIEGVTLLDSPFWVIHPLKSNDITVRGVTINNDGPNGDGCDPESCDRVLIENCFFNTGDDCIAIKSGRNLDGRRRAMPSQNIIIRNCEMRNGHGGVVIGSEISGGCKNVFAHDCVMDSPSLDRVLRIKTNSCRGGIIENIYMRDVKVGQCGESVLKINLDYEHNEICCRGNYPTVRNVMMERVTCEKSKYGVQIIGLNEDTYVYNINVRDCRLNGVAQGNTITGKTRDIVFDKLYVNGGLTLSEMPYKHYSEWMTHSEMKRVPQSFLLDFSTRPKWSYVMGIELEAMLDTYLAYGGEQIKQYCQQYTDTMINQRGDIRGYNILDYNLDNIRTGHFVTRMYQQWPEAKNLAAMQTMMRQLQDQPRTVADKVYWHKAIYAYQVWLDGIFMGLPYRCLTAPITTKAQMSQKVLGTPKGQKTMQAKIYAIYDDAVNQLKLTYQRTLDPKTGLNRHAYDETRKTFWADPETGLSQHCWGRAQGWYTMALIEVLDALPTDYSRRQEVIDLLVKDLDAVIKWQDKTSGVWYQVMDQPGREDNYLESTCSAMFAYALLKAYRLGYVGAKYREAGIKAYRGIINNFIRVNADKTISLTQCCSVAGLGPAATPEVEAAMKRINPKGKVKENRRRDGSYAYYLSEPIRDNDAKGLGPFIWASLEMEQMGYTTENVMQPIDRQAVVSRNNPIITKADPLASLTVGNGHFATTVDVTGLQSFPFDYEAGVPLTAMSDWGWHKFENTDHLTPDETRRMMDLGHGHEEEYAVEYKQKNIALQPAAKQQAYARSVAATDYFRVNPHRLNLGLVGLRLRKAGGSDVQLDELSDIRQELKLYDGVIESRFRADGQQVEVTTACLQDCDAVVYRIKSPLLRDQRAIVRLRLPYPTGRHADAAADLKQPTLHSYEVVQRGSHSATIRHDVGKKHHYYVSLSWQGEATLESCDRNEFELATSDDVLAFKVEYIYERHPIGRHLFSAPKAMVFDQELRAVIKAWNRWWKQGAIVDFSACTDPRAKELERRVVLSQYLTQVNCARSLKDADTPQAKAFGGCPPQETGLTYNSWYGRPHLEMAWWHLVHFALWNRPQNIEAALNWYDTQAYPVAKHIAERQGFRGVRWMKMTDPQAGEAPSNTGSFLLWQQPHYIYMAEEMYRADTSAETLQKYSKGVEQTAEFMADFVSKDKQSGRYYLKGATAMQESMSKDFSFNHPFELAYWQYGLNMANRWRERMGLERRAEWDDIAAKLSALPEQDGIYTAGQPIRPFKANAQTAPFDPFTAYEQQNSRDISKDEFLLKCRSDHPAVLGACGLLPNSSNGHALYTEQKMRTTLEWVMRQWNWPTTWGWDYGMVAMAAARLGQPDVALQALLIDTQKNTYLPQGHNFQTSDRLRLYLPGNGALLTAVAMMCAGWDGCKLGNNPGFPKDGRWQVKWEGLQQMQ